MKTQQLFTLHVYNNTHDNDGHGAYAAIDENEKITFVDEQCAAAHFTLEQCETMMTFIREHNATESVFASQFTIESSMTRVVDDNSTIVRIEFEIDYETSTIHDANTFHDALCRAIYENDDSSIDALNDAMIDARIVASGNDA